MTQATAPTQDAVAALDHARDLLRQGRLQDAERVYESVLLLAPDSVEALGVLGYGALQKGQPARSIALLERARALVPGDPLNLMHLGLAYGSAGRQDESLETLRMAVAARPDYVPAGLHLGHALVRAGQDYAGLCRLFRAITDAQSRGSWISEATTPPQLRSAVTAAIRFVAQRQRELFEMALQPLRDRHGREAMARISECLSIYLKDMAPRYADARQRPTFLYFPDLPTSSYFDRSLFPWMEALEGRTAKIREELQSVMPQAEAREQVFHNAGLAGANLRNEQGEPSWEGIYLYRHGALKQDNGARCPQTLAAVDAVPSLARIPGHAPEVMLSVLTPGTHILPHRGVTNTRLVAHLPLLVPPGCALNVGGELHEWKEGRGVVFDDTFEHEAWNRGDRTRVVLILDVWNPHLTMAERDAVSLLIGAIADFRRDWQKA